MDADTDGMRHRTTLTVRTPGGKLWRESATAKPLEGLLPNFEEFYRTFAQRRAAFRLPSPALTIAGALLCFGIRFMAIRRRWQLPVAGERVHPSEAGEKTTLSDD